MRTKSSRRKRRKNETTTKLVETCWACPEQYNTYYNNELVGYLRLRHETFSVECPDSAGELVYYAEPEGDGRFENDERAIYLDKAAEAILEWISKNRPELLA